MVITSKRWIELLSWRYKKMLEVTRAVITSTSSANFIYLYLCILLSLTTTTLFGQQAAASTICPSDCLCLQDNQNSEAVKAICNWDALTKEKVSALPSAPLLLSLTVKCNSSQLDSKYSDYMFASAKNLQSLEIGNCVAQNHRIPAKLLHQLKELRTLKLNGLHHKAVRVPDNLFSHNARLEELHLAHNNIAHFPATTFCPLRELRVLNFSHNQVAHLETNCSLPTLLMLDASHNALTSLDSGKLQTLSSLHVLRLSDNRIETVDNGAIFTALPKLRELYLDGNQITDLRSVTVKMPDKLQIIDLARNSLQLFNSKMFDSESLIGVNLSRNALKADQLQSIWLPNAQWVDLSHNRIERLASAAFSNITFLHKLDMSHNQLRSIEPMALRDLKYLQSLDLSHNQLGSVQQDSFYRLDEIQLLDLSSNVLVNFSHNFFAGMPKLTDLNLSNNRIQEIPSAITVLYYLIRLFLANNSIETMHQFLLERLPNLRQLDLSSNRIQKIERYIFENARKLEWLNLAKNHILELRANCFNKINNLHSLLLQDNRIKNIEAVFAHLPLLEVLNLTNNQLSQLDYSLLPPNLATLLAADNQIRRLTHNIISQTRPTSLLHLDLSHNNIKLLVRQSLPNSIRTANFSHNEVKEIGDAFLAQKSNLSWVDLSFNQIVVLNRSGIQLDANAIRSTQPVLYLDHNSLTCSCQLDWVKDVDSDIQALPQLGNTEPLSCTDASTGASNLIDTLPKSQFLCSYDVICKEDCVCCEFAACYCKNVCPAGCRCWHDSDYQENIVDCSGNRNGVNSAEQTEVKFATLPMYASKIYLDGRQIKRITRFAFFGHRTKQLLLNNSNVEAIDSKAFNELPELELLNLSDNQIDKLLGSTFNDVPKLSHLYLHNNRLSTLDPTIFDALQTLRVLTLHGNLFQTLPAAMISVSPSLQAVSLSNNPWKCDCYDRFKIQSWLPRHTGVVKDHGSVECVEDLSQSENATVLSLFRPQIFNSNVIKINFWAFISEINTSFCGGQSAIDKEGQRIYSADGLPLIPNNSDHSETRIEGSEIPLRFFEDQSTLMIIVSCGCLLFTAVIVILVVWKCRAKMQEKFLLRSTSPSTYSTNNSRPYFHQTPSQVSPSAAHEPLLSQQVYAQYDAFVAYNPQDLMEVKEILEMLRPYNYRLCLLHSEVNQCLLHNLIEKVNQCQLLILILSQSFLDNEWHLAPVRTAINQFLVRKRDNLLVINLRGDLSEIDNTLGKYVRVNNNLDYGQNMFWETLCNLLLDKIQFRYQPSESDIYDYDSVLTHQESVYV